jgi:glycosyltransferase involved in cell wall biosynthesis
VKVLVVSHAFPPDGVGGTERYAEAVALGLAARSHEVRVFAGSLEWRERFTVERSDQRGVPVTRVHRDDLYFDSWDKVGHPRVALAFEDELDAWRPDVVHLQHWIRLTDDLVRRVAARGIPAVVHLHDLFTNCPRVFRIRPARAPGAAAGDVEFCREPFGVDACRSCVPRWKFQGDREIDLSISHYGHAVEAELAAATTLVALSKAQLDDLSLHSAAPRREVEIVNHPWLPGAVDAPVPPARSPAGKLRLLYFSRLAPLKGAHVVLEAMRRLADRDARGGKGGVAIDLWGAFATPEYEKRLRALASGLDATFHGAYSHNDPCRTPADVAVVPTLAHETWSFWLDEAAHTGLPIVASDAGAIAERATGRVRLVPAGDVAALAAALAELRDDPARRDALAAAPGPALVDLQQHLTRIESLLADAVRRGAPRGVPAMARPGEEWLHAWERRELAFRELLRLEQWEEAKRQYEARIRELEALTAQLHSHGGGGGP